MEYRHIRLKEIAVAAASADRRIVFYRAMSARFAKPRRLH